MCTCVTVIDKGLEYTYVASYIAISYEIKISYMIMYSKIVAIRSNVQSKFL